jgi:hypothetical protein
MEGLDGMNARAFNRPAVRCYDEFVQNKIRKIKMKRKVNKTLIYAK